MPRKSGIDAPGALHHIIARGIERKNIFRDNEEVMASGKHPRTVYARSLLCYLATGELGIRQTYLAEKLKISQPAVSLAVNRGKEIVKVNQYSLIGI